MCARRSGPKGNIIPQIQMDLRGHPEPDEVNTIVTICTLHVRMIYSVMSNLTYITSLKNNMVNVGGLIQYLRKIPKPKAFFCQDSHRTSFVIV